MIEIAIKNKNKVKTIVFLEREFYKKITVESMQKGISRSFIIREIIRKCTPYSCGGKKIGIP